MFYEHAGRADSKLDRPTTFSLAAVQSRIIGAAHAVKPAALYAKRLQNALALKNKAAKSSGSNDEDDA